MKQDTMIEVSCLSCRNAGHFHSASFYIDEYTDVEELEAEIQRDLIGGCSLPQAHEYLINSATGFNGYRVEETAELQTLVDFLELVEDHGDVARAAASISSGGISDIKEICSKFSGVYDNYEELGASYVEEYKIHEDLAGYFNYRSYGERIAMDYSVSEFEKNIYLFSH